MAFLIVKEEEVAQDGQGGYLSTSGIYDLTLKHAEVKSTTNGATQVNYYTDKIISYGNTVANKNGEAIFGMKILAALTAVIGEGELSDPEPTEVKFKNSTKELMCLPELNDVSVKAWVQFSYRLYKGEIQENVAMKRFYRDSDGASGSELVPNGPEIGTTIAKDSEYASEVKYEDGLDADAVAAWKASKKGGGSPQAPKAPAEKKPNPFMKK